MSSEFTCFRCGRSIRAGERMLTVGWQYETFKEGALSVEQAHAVATWCVECGPSLAAVTKAIDAFVHPLLASEDSAKFGSARERGG